MSYEQREKGRLRTETWARFEEACREALAAGNEVSTLRHTLETQHKRVEEAKDTLWVR